ncbi:MAG: sugar transferase [Nitrosopumilaceae archaeon]
MLTTVRITKRLIDLTLSSLVLTLGAPVFLLIALAIKVDSMGPILYRSQRLKRCDMTNFRCPSQLTDEHTFTMYKFRTMVPDAEAVCGAIHAIKNDPRVTRIGRFLRSTRLDELPNFINVFRGEMSVAGPRADRIEDREAIRIEFPMVWERTRYVKPGITGLAQVKLRSDGTLHTNNDKDIHEIADVLPECDKDSHVLSYRYKLYYDFAYALYLHNFWKFITIELYILLYTPIIMFVRRNTI